MIKAVGKESGLHETFVAIRPLARVTAAAAIVLEISNVGFSAGVIPVLPVHEALAVAI